MIFTNPNFTTRWVLSKDSEDPFLWEKEIIFLMSVRYRIEDNFYGYIDVADKQMGRLLPSDLVADTENNGYYDCRLFNVLVLV